MADGVVTIAMAGQPLAGKPASLGDPRCPLRFGEFVAGPENRLVEPAVQGVLNHRPTPYNPLVLYGPSGTGKSHLARGLATAWKDRFPASRIAYATAVDFARELGDAIETHAVEEFRDRYRGVELAVFEDIGQLADKQAAQEEMIGTLDALRDSGGQVVVTARAAPVELAGLMPALQGRLSAGLTVPLAAPGPEARAAVLARWVRLQEIGLSEPILRMLAEGLQGTVPELCGAMLQLELPARQEGRTLDAKAVRDFLAERDLTRRPEIRDIALAAARYYSLRLADLRGASRRRPVVVARDVAMFLCRQLTRSSLQGIGEYFGDRDHTTVMHSCRKMETLFQNNPEIRQAVETLHQKLG